MNKQLYCYTCNCKCIHLLINNKCNHRCSRQVQKKQCTPKSKYEIDVSNLFDSVDTKLDLQIDYLHQQLNIINKSYLDVIDNIQTANNQHVLVVNEINKINDTIENILIHNNHDHTCGHCGKIIYTEPKQYVFVVENDIKFVYLTGIGGGGSGGVGCIRNMFYYSGGGGGAGACIINKPIAVNIGTIINIYIGKGGSSSDGEPTVIEIIQLNGDKETITLDGGQRGAPYLELVNSTMETLIIKGGHGGVTTICTFSGADGQDGNISVPSFSTITSGNGGCSHFFTGGRGGSNYFSRGGIGGVINALIGENGTFGSGGGGSAPKTIIDSTKQVSGNGGNGMVIIEW